jgi:hypothetical protein
MYEPPDLVFSFLTFKLSAKGVVVLLLAFPVALILTAIVGGYSMAKFINASFKTSMTTQS